MNELELMLLKHEAFVHRAKLQSMRGMIVLSEAGKAFIDAEVAELTEQIDSMDEELDAKKARRLGRTRLRNRIRNLVFSIVTGERQERKEAAH